MNAEQGLRVLVIEDEILVAMLIEEMCADLGCIVVGTAATLEEALSLSRQADFDVCLVDMNLKGVNSEPVLADLHERSVPFAIVSGNGDAAQDDRAALVLGKPFSFSQFSECLSKLAAGVATDGSARRA